MRLEARKFSRGLGLSEAVRARVSILCRTLFSLTRSRITVSLFYSTESLPAPVRGATRGGVALGARNRIFKLRVLDLDSSPDRELLIGRALTKGELPILWSRVFLGNE